MSPPPWAQMTLGHPLQDILTRGQSCRWEGRERPRKRETEADRQVDASLGPGKPLKSLRLGLLSSAGCDSNSTRRIGCVRSQSAQSRSWQQ